MGELISFAERKNKNSNTAEQNERTQRAGYKTKETSWNRMRAPYRKYRLEPLIETIRSENENPVSKFEKLSKKIRESSRKGFVNYTKQLMRPFRRIGLESLDRKTVSSTPHPELVDDRDNTLLNFPRHQIPERDTRINLMDMTIHGTRDKQDTLLNFPKSQIPDRNTRIDLLGTTLHDKGYTHVDRKRSRSRMGYDKYRTMYDRNQTIQEKAA